MGARPGNGGPSPGELAVAAALLAAGVAAGAVSLQAAWSARSVAASYFDATIRGDLGEHRRVSTPAHAEHARAELCRARWGRIRHVYDVVVPELAMPKWIEIRREAEDLARGEAERLRVLIHERGTMAIGELEGPSLDALVSDPRLRARFVFECGVERLDAADRTILGAPSVFLESGGRDDGFVTRAAWSVLPPSRRSELGSAEVLSRADSQAKRDWLDAVARPLLEPRTITHVAGRAFPGSPASWQAEGCRVVLRDGLPASAAPTTTEVTPDWASVIEGVPRADVETFETFVERHGDATAHAVLVAALAGPASRSRLTFRDEETGSLFRGPRSVGTSSFGVRGGGERVECVMDRKELSWKVAQASLDFARLAEQP